MTENDVTYKRVKIVLDAAIAAALFAGARMLPPQATLTLRLARLVAAGVLCDQAYKRACDAVKALYQDMTTK